MILRPLLPRGGTDGDQTTGSWVWEYSCQSLLFQKSFKMMSGAVGGSFRLPGENLNHFSVIYGIRPLILVDWLLHGSLWPPACSTHSLISPSLFLRQPHDSTPAQAGHIRPCRRKIEFRRNIAGTEVSSLETASSFREAVWIPIPQAQFWHIFGSGIEPILRTCFLWKKSPKKCLDTIIIKFLSSYC